MEPIYLEPAEEITSVIDKLSASSGGKVAIVVPKNSTLFQSLINLKLLAKKAKELGKDVAIISGNKVGQRLASQVGVETYSSLGTIKEAPITAAAAAAVPAVDIPDETLPDGTKVHRYVPPPTAEAEEDSQTVEPPVEEPIAASPPVIEPQPLPPDVQLPDEVPAPTAETELVAAKEEDGDQNVEPVEAVAASNDPDDLPPIISRTPVPKREFNFQVPWKSLIAAAILLLLAFGITYLLLPKATVTITLPAKPVSSTLALSAKTVDDSAETTVPGNLLSVEKSATKVVNATGKKDVGTKSGGTITISNKASSSSVTLSAGTVLTTAGKNFTLDKATTVPGASVSGGNVVPGQAQAAITASSAGESFNVSNAQFSVSGQSSLVYGNGSTSGGTTKQVTVLSQEDVDKAYAELEKQLTDEAAAELKTKAEKQTMLEGSTTQVVKERSADKKVGDEAASATVKVTLEALAIVFDSQKATDKVKTALEGQIEEGQQLVVPENSQPVLVFKDYSEDKKVLNFEARGSGYGVAKISKPEIAKSIRHKSKNKAEALLKETYKSEEVKIELMPSWWISRLPFLSGAIKVEYGFTEVAAEPIEVPAP